MSSLLLAAGVAASAGCLPQEDNSSDSDVIDDTDGPIEIRTWRMLALEDLGASEDGSDMPGADIDAIAAFIDDEFVFAGCQAPALHGTDPDVLAESEHSDAETASLHARDEAGFFSLAGGVLICSLPVPIVTGTVIEIWEIESDGAESWQASVADSALGDYEVVGIVDGSGTFVAP